ncbi:MAG: ACP phosphodiesterase [Thermoanaerobaculia bacterium]
MNFLAHFLLASAHDDLVVGNLIADFARGSVEKVDQRYRVGVVLHRRIDATTDEHEATRRAVARVRGACGRWSAVAADVVLDHVLAREWARYSTEPLEHFSARIYRTLAQRSFDLPPRGQRLAAAMASGDWLTSYREIDGIAGALRNMERRIGRGAALAPAAEIARERYEEFRVDFEELFADLRRVAKATLAGRVAEGGVTPSDRTPG